MQNKKILIIILCGVLALVLLFMGVCAAMLITGGSSDGSGSDGDIYQKQLDLGNKYLEEENYEQAIAAFKAAIEEDPENEEAYSLLARVYHNLGYTDQLRFLLADGISRTSSALLIGLFEEYFGISYLDEKIKLENSSGIYIVKSVAQQIANYSYNNYKHDYTGVTVDVNGDIYIVKMSGFDGRLYFYDEGDKKSLDRDAKEPLGEVRPNYVVLDDLGFIFGGLEGDESVDYHELHGMGATDIEKKHDTSFGDYVRFVYAHCVMEIAIDGNDCFNVDSSNKLYSEFGTGAEGADNEETTAEDTEEVDTEEAETEPTPPPVETFEVSIKVVSATTAEGVGNAAVQVLDTATGMIVYNGSTTGDGTFTATLPAGIYAFQVICDGYVIESFEVEVYSTGICSVDTIVISPELSIGEMRIVLEWGDHPRDLDSYYLDDTGAVGVAYYSRQYYNGDQLVAELDVDDTNGYGPETITVYDPSQTFTYCVRDYTNTGDMFQRTDITVKVYIAGESQPIVYTPTYDETNEGRVWTVFSFVNGEIQFINESSPDFE